MREEVPQNVDSPVVTPQTDSPGIVLASEVLPERIPIVPLRGRPMFPGIPAPIELPQERLPILQRAIERYRETLGLVLVADSDAPDSPQNLRRVGTAAKLLRAVQAESEGAHVLVNCLQRFTLRSVTIEDGVWIGEVAYHREPEYTVNRELKAYAMAVLGTLKQLVQLNPLQVESIRMYLNRSSLDDPGRLADFSANLTTASADELQQVLETFDIRHRLDRVLVLLKKEVELARLQGEINRNIEETISKHQREFFLREQMKSIKKELGLE